jgi:hypothetical protein
VAASTPPSRRTPRGRPAPAGARPTSGAKRPVRAPKKASGETRSSSYRDDRASKPERGSSGRSASGRATTGRSAPGRDDRSGTPARYERSTSRDTRPASGAKRTPRAGDSPTRAPVPIERVQRRALDALVLVQATRHALRATTTLAPRARIERVLNRARVDPGLAQRQIAHRGTREIASPHRSRPSSVNAKQPASTLVAKAGGASRAKVLSTSRVRDKSSVTPRPNHELLNRRRPGSVLSGRNVRPHPPRRRPAHRTRCRPTSRPTYARPSSVRPICARRWCTL